jgi:tetratricopeptide (TPR) repeat protein
MKPAKTPENPLKKYGKYLIAVLAIAAVILVASYFLIPQSDSARFQEAGALYTKSVDLANAGSYSEALTDSDQALALNVTPLIPIIQANRAGILVALGRNTEAITAADVALAGRGNLSTLKSIAWFNKGNALVNLGRISEARAAYSNATALDPTLKAPAI